jgi:hypothetical protein
LPLAAAVEALAWRGALGDQQVLVKAAGNNNTA